MTVIINTFLFIFFIAFTIDAAISGFQVLHLILIFFSALATSLLSYYLGVIKNDRELSFLYLNIYSLFIKKYLADFVKMTLSLHKPFFLDFNPHPTLFKVQIQHHDKINKAILSSMIDMSQGLLLYDISKDIALIYCINEVDYTGLNLLRLTKDVKDINDNSLV